MVGEVWWGWQTKRRRSEHEHEDRLRSQGLYSIAVVVAAAEYVAADRLDEAKYLLEDAIIRLMGPSDIRQRWAAAVRKACQGDVPEVHSMLHVAVDSVDGFTEKWLLWVLGLDLEERMGEPLSEGAALANYASRAWRQAFKELLRR